MAHVGNSKRREPWDQQVQAKQQARGEATGEEVGGHSEKLKELGEELRPWSMRSRITVTAKALGPQLLLPSAKNSSQPRVPVFSVGHQ